MVKFSNFFDTTVISRDFYVSDFLNTCILKASLRVV